MCVISTKWVMNSPAAVREGCKTVLQQVCHFKVDVIAGDDNAEAKRYFQKKKKSRSLQSSAAVMLREMQHEVNTGHPFERKLHKDCSTNNHSYKLHAATDTDSS